MHGLDTILDSGSDIDLEQLDLAGGMIIWPICFWFPESCFPWLF